MSVAECLRERAKAMHRARCTQHRELRALIVHEARYWNRQLRHALAAITQTSLPL